VERYGTKLRALLEAGMSNTTLETMVVVAGVAGAPAGKRAGRRPAGIRGRGIRAAA